MTLEIDEATMKKVADMTAVSNPKTGYVSHSWNQFIQADDNYIYRLDQGDFYRVRFLFPSKRNTMKALI